MTFVTLANERRAAYPPLPFFRHGTGWVTPKQNFFYFIFPPPSKFFIFSTLPHSYFFLFFHPKSLPYLFLYRFCPFFSLLTGFLCLCVYFIVRMFFVALRAKNRAQKKGRQDVVCPVCPFGYLLCRNDVLFFCGSIALTFPFVFGVVLS